MLAILPFPFVTISTAATMTANFGSYVSLRIVGRRQKRLVNSIIRFPTATTNIRKPCINNQKKALCLDSPCDKFIACVKYVIDYKPIFRLKIIKIYLVHNEQGKCETATYLIYVLIILHPLITKIHHAKLILIFEPFNFMSFIHSTITIGTREAIRRPMYSIHSDSAKIFMIGGIRKSKP